MIGSSLGPYKIIEKLGAGGMGEVYLGEDTRLGRKVAIKVLPAEFASDPERLARFEQEARAAAALNHPHIAVVHDIGTEGDTHFMVQEYLDGQSLRERLGKGALPPDKALDLAIEVGEALIAAHKAGIIHRDLKPDNIFVTDEGHSKVLDFGLAKLTEATAPAEAELSMSPTMLGTVAGQLMGTAGYMAPEQVRGEEADRRADVFAFGCVLYEMVTGRRAFSGRSVHQTLDLIVNEEPEPLRLSRPELPRRLAWILEKSMSKDPARRYQAADDLVVDLRALAAEPSGDAAATTDRGRDSRSTFRVHRIVFVAALLLLAALSVGAVLGWFLTGTRESPSTLRASLMAPTQHRLWGGSGRRAVLSPDGTKLAYVAMGPDGLQLFVRSLSQDRTEFVAIENSGGAYQPFFSFDGRWVGFFVGNELRKVAASGGPPVTICADCPSPYGAAWGPDGTIIVSLGSTGLWSLAEQTGELTLLAEPRSSEGEESLRWPELLPGGRELLVTAWSFEGLDRTVLDRRAEAGLSSTLSALQGRPSVYVTRMDAADERTLLQDEASTPMYAQSGHLLFSRAGSLFAVPFDLTRLRTVGTPTVVVESMRVRSNGLALYNVSEDGELLYQAAENPVLARELVWVDLNGNEALVTPEQRFFATPRLSPNGRRVAVTVTDEQTGNSNVWILDRNTDRLQRLTREASNVAPVWSTDGEWVLFASNRGGSYDLYRKQASLSDEDPAELIREADLDQFPTAVSPDANLVAVSQRSESGGWESVFVALPEANDTAGLAALPATSVSWSRPGGWIAYVSDGSGRNQVYARPFPESGGSVPISQDGGLDPIWSHSGTRIFYAHDGRMVMTEISRASDTLSPGPPEELFSISHFYPDEPDERAGIAGEVNPGWDIDPNDSRFLMVRWASGEEDRKLTLVLNWFEELKERVPTGR